MSELYNDLTISLLKDIVETESRNHIPNFLKDTTIFESSIFRFFPFDPKFQYIVNQVRNRYKETFIDDTLTLNLILGSIVLNIKCYASLRNKINIDNFVFFKNLRGDTPPYYNDTINVLNIPYTELLDFDELVTNIKTRTINKIDSLNIDHCLFIEHLGIININANNRLYVDFKATAYAIHRIEL